MHRILLKILSVALFAALAVGVNARLDKYQASESVSSPDVSPRIVAPKSHRFRIRTITAGVNLKSTSDLATVESAIGFLQKARKKFADKKAPLEADKKTLEDALAKREGEKAAGKKKVKVGREPSRDPHRLGVANDRHRPGRDRLAMRWRDRAARFRRPRFDPGSGARGPRPTRCPGAPITRTR